MKYQKEILLIQAILLTLIWLINDYLGHLLTYIFVPVFIAILVISLIAEKIERSKVPKYYFTTLVWMILVFVVIYLIFSGISGFSMDWMK
mgnify:CR=1 FL=1